LNGIDFLEVAPDQTHLDVHFLRDLSASPALDADNLRVEGGVRTTGIAVVGALSTAPDVLTVHVDSPGDFSTYRLRIVDPAVPAKAPAGFDPRLSSVDFSFKAACSSDFDCAEPEVCPPEARQLPALDYLAKDYESLRGLMLDRLATTLPNWTERNPADVQIALVELLAYVADRLSYYQDAVATEAYLSTARRRVSVRRHARLLDYRMHDGCNARVFVHFHASTGLTLESGRAVQAGPDEDAVVFQTMHAVDLRAAHDEIALYTWGDDLCCLPEGATRATLEAGAGLDIGEGDFLLLEESLSPTTGLAADADPAHRQVVRLTSVTPGTDPLTSTPIVEVEWNAQDALTFPLCVTSIATRDDGTREHVVCGVARGNIALADQGLEVSAALPLVDDPVDPPGRWRPRLPDLPVTNAIAFDESAPAAVLTTMDPRTAVPVVRLDDGELLWEPDPAGDLISAGPAAPAFVLEVEDDGETRVRFGDGISGMQPPRGTEFTAAYRVGNGATGNVPAESIDRLREAESGIDAVRNPLPATGGTEPEPTEQVRRIAPQAYRIQERAVTANDYGNAAGEVAGVQRAACRLRWTGSWYTAFVTVDQTGGGHLRDDVATRVQTLLDTRRMAGVDVELADPEPLPVDLALDICVAPGFFARQVEVQVLEALSSRVLPDGRRGFFHPDNFTFGRPLYLSQVYAAVLAVPGVAQVTATALHRFGRSPGDELAKGLLAPRGLEIVQLANDPSFPEQGRLTLTMEGGL
jgi:hypothetical protein